MKVLFTVKGKVQGVGFRQYAREQAERLNLAAEAKNLPDGSMQAVVSGEERDIAKFKAALKAGPGAVESVEQRSLSGGENLKTKAALVIDNGSFLELAVTLSKSFGKVWYYSSWVSSFPTSNSMLIGTGIPGVERVNDFWEKLPEADIVVCPDLFWAGLQTYLQKQKHLRVWGGRWAEELELDRPACKEHLKKLGIEVGKWEVVKGLSALRRYLKTHERKWIKISTTRGDGETAFAKNYPLVESVLDEFEHFLGAGKEIKEFLLEDDIPDSLDIAGDLYTIDGQFPQVGQIGHEVKDRAYLGVCLPRAKWPKQITDTNDKLADTFKKYGCRQWVALETRVTRDGKPYVNDPCIRMSSPPGGLLLNQYTNTDRIVWDGAAGICVDPVPAGKYGCSLVIYSEWAEKNFLNVQFPEKYRDSIKLKNFCRIGGRYYVVPQAVGLCEIGEVVATGNTLDDARKKCQEIAAQVEGHKVKTFKDALDEAENELEKLAEYGIKLA